MKTYTITFTKDELEFIKRHLRRDSLARFPSHILAAGFTFEHKIETAKPDTDPVSENDYFDGLGNRI